MLVHKHLLQEIDGLLSAFNVLVLQAAKLGR